jgi:hypothetical protein
MKWNSKLHTLFIVCRTNDNSFFSSPFSRAVSHGNSRVRLGEQPSPASRVTVNGRVRGNRDRGSGPGCSGALRKGGASMKTCKLATFSAILLALAFVALPASAESHVRIVRLSFQQGNVEIDRNTGQSFEKAIENMPIVEGTKLRTGQDGQAEVELEDGTVVRLVPDSEIGFPHLALDSGNKLTTISVDQGTAYFDIRHKGHDLITLALPGRQLDLDHSAHFRVSVGSDQIRLAVFSGEVTTGDHGHEITVKKKETVALDINDPEYHLAKGVDSMVGDSWDRDRTEYQEAYATNAGFSTGPLSPYYGWSDLNYYGGWYSLPGYGMLWQPYNMYAGWSPFGSGAWAWYPGPGWMWVSSYPWGWLPYRYGNWLFVPGWGWAWQPGTVWNSWYSVPRIFNPPVGFVPLLPPAVINGAHPGPTVIVRGSPLAPHVPADGIRKMQPLPKGATVISAPGILNPMKPSPNRGFSPSLGVPRNAPAPHVGPSQRGTPRTSPQSRTEAVPRGNFMTHIDSGFGHVGSAMGSVAHAGVGGHFGGGFGSGHGR